MNKQSIACLSFGTLVLLSLAGGYPKASLGPVTTPFVFQAGNPVRAAEMNENFLAHEIAINGNSVDITDQDTRITALEAGGGGGGSGTLLAFRAVVSGMTTGNAPGTIVCDNEIFDEGAGYDASTGIFTAPTEGLYQFSFITTGARPGSTNLSMVKNGTNSLGTVQVVINHAGSIVLTELLAVGDQVAVTRTQSTELLGSQTDGPFTVFSGHLIQEK